MPPNEIVRGPHSIADGRSAVYSPTRQPAAFSRSKTLLAPEPLRAEMLLEPSQLRDPGALEAMESLKLALARVRGLCDGIEMLSVAAPPGGGARLMLSAVPCGC